MIQFDKESQARVLKVAEDRAAGRAVDPDDERIAHVLNMHPEYDALWTQGELACYPQEVNGKVVNPFVHMVLHVRIDHQLLHCDPAFVAATRQRLLEQGMEEHDCLHALIYEYADIYFANFRRGRIFDALAYESRLNALSFARREEEAQA